MLCRRGHCVPCGIDLKLTLTDHLACPNVRAACAWRSQRCGPSQAKRSRRVNFTLTALGRSLPDQCCLDTRVLAVATHLVQYMARMANYPAIDFHVSDCSLRGAEAPHDRTKIKRDAPHHMGELRRVPVLLNRTNPHGSILARTRA